MRYAERVNLAIDWIVSDLSRPLRLNELAEIAGLSPFHFHRVFQAMTGELPAEFVKRLRLEKALRIMAHGKRQSLTRVALECGFSSSSDFSRCFKQRYGSSPSGFDLDGWRKKHGDELEKVAGGAGAKWKVGGSGAADANPDGFRVTIRELPARTVAYIRVRDPYKEGAVFGATERLMAWAKKHGVADGQWLGYQWDNPEISPLEDCTYHVAVEVGVVEGAMPPIKGEIGKFRFPAMTVAQVEIRGGIDLELRALYWLYGTWLPRSRYVPDDHPGFEAWIGKPFAHGVERFELHVQLPVKRI